MSTTELQVIKQHLIDPEICIRCNTCEATCPIGAISHDSRNYVVDADICNWCGDCIPPCPTGAIDNYRQLPKIKVYPLAEQLLWDELPKELPRSEWGDGIEGGEAATAPSTPSAQSQHSAQSALTLQAQVPAPQAVGATLPPWSAAHAYTNLYGPKAEQKTVLATVVGNVRVTEVGREYDTHHVMLDFGSMPFPVLEGQSIGVIPPGFDGLGRPHHARQYSIASPRNGERPGYNNVSLTIKRVLQDHQGRPVKGIASNFMCDLKVGDKVQVIGPFGTSFLMPNHPRSHIVMICTGTGSAPMRAMTEWRRRLRQSGKFESGKLMLFFGARTQAELPYFGPLQNLPKDFIDTNFAFSRTPDQPRRYVQDLMRERAADLAPLLADPNAYFYVCGLKAMEEGVVQALQSIAQNVGMDWPTVANTLRQQARLHLETY